MYTAFAKSGRGCMSSSRPCTNLTPSLCPVFVSHKPVKTFTGRLRSIEAALAASVATVLSTSIAGSSVVYQGFRDWKEDMNKQLKEFKDGTDKQLTEVKEAIKTSEHNLELRIVAVEVRMKAVEEKLDNQSQSMARLEGANEVLVSMVQGGRPLHGTPLGGGPVQGKGEEQPA